MPSPGKVSIVPPVHEVLRFSSLPCSPGPLADVMDVDKIAKLSEESERVRNPSKSPTSPSHKGLDSSSCKTPVAEDKNLPSISQLPSVAPGQEATPSTPSNVSPSALPQSPDVRPFSVLAGSTFTFVQLPVMATHGLLEGPENDVTPKPINPPPITPLDVNPIPFALGGLSSLSDDPPSPLSALSSQSEFDPSPPPPPLHDTEIDTPHAELPSGIPRATQPSSSPPSYDTTKNSGSEVPQVARRATSTSRGRGGRGFAGPSGSARLTRSASMKKQKEAGSIYGDIDPSSLFDFATPVQSF